LKVRMFGESEITFVVMNRFVSFISRQRPALL